LENLIKGKVGDIIDHELRGGVRIHEERGMTTPIFVPRQTFESLMRWHGELLRAPEPKVVNLIAQ
jgi:hypothetical protein